MYTEYFTVDDGCKREEIKHLAAGLPDAGVAVLLLAFLVEPVHLCNLSRLVVAADQCDFVRISAEHQGQYTELATGTKRRRTLLSGTSGG